MEEGFTRMGQTCLERVQELMTTITDRMDTIVTQLDHIKVRVDTMETSLDTIKERMGTLSTTIQSVQTTVNTIANSPDQIEASIRVHIGVEVDVIIKGLDGQWHIVGTRRRTCRFGAPCFPGSQVACASFKSVYKPIAQTHNIVASSR